MIAGGQLGRLSLRVGFLFPEHRRALVVSGVGRTPGERPASYAFAADGATCFANCAT
jgi:hypothetical protein